MSKDEIIPSRTDVLSMAREAGFKHPEAVGQCEDFAYFDLERFAALVAAAEREACAYRAGIALLGADRGLANRVDQAIRAREQE